MNRLSAANPPSESAVENATFAPWLLARLKAALLLRVSTTLKRIARTPTIAPAVSAYQRPRIGNCRGDMKFASEREERTLEGVRCRDEAYEVYGPCALDVREPPLEGILVGSIGMRCDEVLPSRRTRCGCSESCMALCLHFLLPYRVLVEMVVIAHGGGAWA